MVDQKLQLRYWRKRRKMTIDDLSAKAKMSTQTIIKIEKYGHIPTPTTLGKLEDALGVTTEQLFEGPGASETANPHRAA